MPLFEDTRYNLANLIENIDTGVIGLPDIQRPFVWKDTKVRDLFDSMYRGYPVGYLLFWANAYQENTRTIGTDGETHNAPNLLIVDGQQRLTSLYAVIKGRQVVRENYEREHIEISFNPLEERFEVPDAASRHSNEYIHNISDVWQTQNIIKFTIEFIKRLKETKEITTEEETTIQNNIGKLYNLRDFPFSALKLSPNMSEEEVAQVFVRINSTGKPLNQADFILTLMSVFWDEGRMELEEFARKSKTQGNQEATPFNFIFQPDADEMLRAIVGLGFRRARLQYAYSILRGKDLDTGEFSEERRDTQFATLKENQDKALNLNTWHEYLKTIKKAGYLRGDFISSKNNIVYVYTIFLLGKYDYGVEANDLRTVVARWFAFVSLTGRYTGSPETKMERDLALLRDVRTAQDFIQKLNHIIDTELTSDYWTITLPEALATSSSRSPELFAYYASLKILGAKGLFSALQISELLQEDLKEQRSPLERHHLFPRAYLERNGVNDQTKRNQIANYALVEWGDNNDIADQAPSEYLPLYLNRMSANEKEEMYFWHALPDGWEHMEYEDFLVERRKLIAQVIRKAFETL
jgi:hypothetical protein